MDLAVVGLLIASTHLGAAIPEGHARNAFTPGVYVVTTGGLTAGLYHNSVNRTSFQLGYTHQLSSRWAISGGFVSGYPKLGRNRILPYVAVSYAFGSSTGGRLIAMPERTLPLAAALEFRP